MSRCVACINRRRFAKASGMRWPGRWLRQCYPHYMLRHARLHIAGRVALLLLVVPTTLASVIGLGIGIGKLARALAPLVAP